MSEEAVEEAVEEVIEEVDVRLDFVVRVNEEAIEEVDVLAISVAELMISDTTEETFFGNLDNFSFY